MATKVDTKVTLLFAVILIQVIYTTWSFLSGYWFVTKPAAEQAVEMIKYREPILKEISISVNRSSDLENKKHRKEARNLLRNAHTDRQNPTIDNSTTKKQFSPFTGPVSDDQNQQQQQHLEQELQSRYSSATGNSSAHDRKSLFDTNNSDGFILNKWNICNESPLAVVIVCSAPGNSDNRNSIRQTWASGQGPEVKVLFLIGRHLNSTVDDQLLLAEDDQYNDIIMADFIDSYANLSRKSILMLRWTVTYCSSAKFLIKTDDDTFINTPLLSRDLQKTVHRRFIMGNVIALAKPVRDPTSKWFTPLSLFNRSSYPTYVSGMAYAISGDAVADLYGASSRVPLFWLEDVYITGLLAGALKIQLIFNGKFDGFKELINVCAMRSHVVRHRITTEQMRILWSIVENQTNKDSSCL